MRWIWQRLVPAFVLAIALCAVPTMGAPQAVIDEVRLGRHGDHTRFVLDMSEKVDFEIFTLADPYRIVVDFPEVAWRLDPAATQGPVGLVKGFRFGLFRPGRSRLVIDLGGPGAVANKFLLPPEGARRYRLVLDLKSTDRAAYLASAGWPADAASAAEDEPQVDAGSKQTSAKRIVVIDPGHGGVDPGASGVGGTNEKDVVLALGKAVRDALERTGKYTVVMTRDSDIFLSLRARVAVGRRAKADLFVSLHADSAPSAIVNGASVYTLSENASDKEADALARSENQSDIIAGVDLTNEPDIVTSILIDLAQRETKNNSVKFAQLLVPELQRAGGVTHKSHRFAGFVVLKAPDVPSVLIEVGYLSNHSDESVMNTGRWRRRMADSISRAVDNYFRHNRSDIKAER
jgi:N-acetylmuramoyl-L-alanine amidase